MRERTTESSVRFRGPFAIEGLDRTLPPGVYRIVIEEEELDGISFLAFRRVSTGIAVPLGAASEEIVQIAPADLDAALDRDRLAFPSTQ